MKSFVASLAVFSGLAALAYWQRARIANYFVTTALPKAASAAGNVAIDAGAASRDKFVDIFSNI